jgi:hypothetical protein
MMTPLTRFIAISVAVLAFTAASAALIIRVTV